MSFKKSIIVSHATLQVTKHFAIQFKYRMNKTVILKKLFEKFTLKTKL